MKLAYLESLKNSGHKVLMVGDGLNDAPTLAAAHVSMAPGTAIDIAQNAADIVFMGTKFMPVYETFKIASLTQKLVKENFVLAVIYNAIAIPVAALGFLSPAYCRNCDVWLFIDCNPELVPRREEIIMDILVYLLPIAIGLGFIWLIAFVWSLKSGQYSDLDGAAHRILIDDRNDPHD